MASRYTPSVSVLENRFLQGSKLSTKSTHIATSTFYT